MSSNKALQATAIAHFLVAAAHTVKGGEFKDSAFLRLRPVLQGQAKAGWFQGSVFFALLGFVNLRWAKEGFRGDALDKAILSLISTVYFGSAAWYVRTGDNATAAVLTPVGLLQLFGALRA